MDLIVIQSSENWTWPQHLELLPYFFTYNYLLNTCKT